MQEEIKRLKEEYVMLQNASDEVEEAKDREIERLHSIIKEVREYIKGNQEEHKYTDRGGFTYTEGHFLRDSDTLLEILDKANKEE